MNILNKLFADKDGNIVIGQRPNLPILVWAGATILKLLSLPSGLITLLDLIAFGALFTWAWLELFQGTCLFRRMLGLVVLGLLLYFNG